jgi:hypothetical protein
LPGGDDIAAETELRLLALRASRSAAVRLDLSLLLLVLSDFLLLTMMGVVRRRAALRGGSLVAKHSAQQCKQYAG